MPCSSVRLSARLGATLAAAGALALSAGAACAADLDAINALNQDQFRQLSDDIGAVAAYKPLIPSEATGVTGFDIGVAALSTQVKNKDAFQLATGDSPPGSLTQLSLRANKGLPFDFDIGAHYTTVLNSNIRVAGGDLRWAAVLGGALIPAVSLRLAVSDITGVDQLKLDTLSFDVSVSKGFAFVTPYLGLGNVNVKATPVNINTLASEKFNLTRLFAGVNVAMGLTNLIVEADRTGKDATVGLKLGVRF